MVCGELEWHLSKSCGTLVKVSLAYQLGFKTDTVMVENNLVRNDFEAKIIPNLILTLNSKIGQFSVHREI